METVVPSVKENFCMFASKVIVPPLTLSSSSKRVVLPCLSERFKPPSFSPGVNLIFPSPVNSTAVVALAVVFTVKV